MISQGRFWRLEEQSIKIVSSSFVEYGSWWWNEVMEINWWKSMPRCCEPCFLIKDPKLLFPGMGRFPRVQILCWGMMSLPSVCGWVPVLVVAGASPGQGAWWGQWHHWWHWPGPALGSPLLLHWAVTAAHSLETHFRIIVIVTLTKLIFSKTQPHSSLPAVISSPTKRSCELPVPYDTHFIWVSFLGLPELSWRLR